MVCVPFQRHTSWQYFLSFGHECQEEKKLTWPIFTRLIWQEIAGFEYWTAVRNMHYACSSSYLHFTSQLPMLQATLDARTFICMLLPAEPNHRPFVL